MTGPEPVSGPTADASPLQWLQAALARPGGRPAVLAGDEVCSYAQLSEAVGALRLRLRAWGLRPGDVLAFAGDYSLAGVTRLCAALLEGLVAVPLAQTAHGELSQALAAVPVDAFFPAGAPLATPPARPLPPGVRTAHPLLDLLRRRAHPGLILLTSGSTGAPKVILHDAAGLLAKFADQPPRQPLRAVVFLLPDHMGGVNTLFAMLSGGSTIVLPGSRDPDAVAALVARHRADLLPVTPSFLNLLLLSEAHRRHDLSSLKVISYGTEPMPEATLARAVALFPGVRFTQLYGTSELGIFRGRASRPDSPWVTLLPEAGVQFRVVDGRLWVHGADSMLGYLSGQPAGFDDQGWYDTGDLVEERDGELRILGRAVELINVGGQKVLPGEVEAALLELPGVVDCSVHGEPHALTGQIVVARVELSPAEEAPAFKARMRQALRGRLEPYKIPVKVELGGVQVSARFKKIRR